MFPCAFNIGMFGKHKPTARDYVQDGLIAMWDGIENAGWGVHVSTAQEWKNLVAGGSSLLFSEGVGTFTDDSFTVTGGERTDSKGSVAYNTDNYNAVRFTEIVFEVKSKWGAWGTSVQGPQLIMLFKKTIAQETGGQIGLVGTGTNNTTIIALSSHINNLNRITDIQWYNRPSTISADYSSTTITRDAKPSKAYVDGIIHNMVSYNIAGRNSSTEVNSFGGVYIPSQGATTYGFSGRLMCIRLYTEGLTAEQVSANYAVDKARFNLP